MKLLFPMTLYNTASFRASGWPPFIWSSRSFSIVGWRGPSKEVTWVANCRPCYPIDWASFCVKHLLLVLSVGAIWPCCLNQLGLPTWILLSQTQGSFLWFMAFLQWSERSDRITWVIKMLYTPKSIERSIHILEPNGNFPLFLCRQLCVGKDGSNTIPSYIVVSPWPTKYTLSCSFIRILQPQHIIHLLLKIVQQPIEPDPCN